MARWLAQQHPPSTSPGDPLAPGTHHGDAETRARDDATTDTLTLGASGHPLAAMARWGLELARRDLAARVVAHPCAAVAVATLAGAALASPRLRSGLRWAAGAGWQAALQPAVRPLFKLLWLSALSRSGYGGGQTSAGPGPTLKP
ncbi:MAG: hypothetical protein CFE46_09725 [Burkholderiales bacterium PBB6]|nr:MAG: hypothetical protein CFE46_09725 [Burkholderiales bacterium PBB6]